jgi:HAMP domain-containing protein
MSRFERKILFAIGLSVFLTLGGSIFLAQGALREVYRVGVNERFGAELVHGVEARRAQLMALRSGSEQVADAVESAVEAELTKSRNTSKVETLLQELLERYELVQGIRVADDAGREVASVSREADPSGAAMRTTTRDREADAGGRNLRIAVEVAVPEVYFERLQEAGEVADVYSRLQRQSASVSDVYVWVFGVMAFLVILVAFLIGAIVSRRVTRRVTVLAEASRQVGAGDLSVTLPTGATDEVTELTQAFNDMVRDLRDSRTRIEYLQRISAWQDFARRLAHEIKNPLTPIQLAAQEMDETYDGENEAQTAPRRSSAVRSLRSRADHSRFGACHSRRCGPWHPGSGGSARELRNGTHPGAYGPHDAQAWSRQHTAKCDSGGIRGAPIGRWPRLGARVQDRRRRLHRGSRQRSWHLQGGLGSRIRPLLHEQSGGYGLGVGDREESRLGARRGSQARSHGSALSFR